VDLALTLVCSVSEPALVCNNWLCTSLDVEVGLCNPLLKKGMKVCAVLTLRGGHHDGQEQGEDDDCRRLGIH
jgi:hypothetical protein